jgi:hypothetical protein
MVSALVVFVEAGIRGGDIECYGNEFRNARRTGLISFRLSKKIEIADRYITLLHNATRVDNWGNLFILEIKLASAIDISIIPQ